MNGWIGFIIMIFSMQISELSLYIGTEAGLPPMLAGTSWMTIWFVGFVFLFYPFGGR